MFGACARLEGRPGRKGSRRFRERPAVEVTAAMLILRGLDETGGRPDTIRAPCTPVPLTLVAFDLHASCLTLKSEQIISMPHSHRPEFRVGLAIHAVQSHGNRVLIRSR